MVRGHTSCHWDVWDVSALKLFWWLCSFSYSKCNFSLISRSSLVWLEIAWFSWILNSFGVQSWISLTYYCLGGGGGGGGDSLVKSMELLVGNFDKNLQEVPRTCLVGVAWIIFNSLRLCSKEGLSSISAGVPSLPSWLPKLINYLFH